MDFTPPPRIATRLPDVRAFVDAEVVPLERRLGAGFRALEPALLSLRARVRDMGLIAPHVAVEHGGAGLSLLELAFLAEELGRSPLAHYVFNCQAPDAGNMDALAQHGTPQQQERFLTPLVRGDVRSCFAMTEPDRPGSNPVWMGTTARAEGDGFVIDGRKWFITGADGAAFAIVMAVSDPEAPSPWMRASLFLVPTDAPGFRLLRNVPVMGHAGESWASHGEIALEGVRVAAGDVLGGRGAGFAIAQDRLGPGRIHHCMRWIGICERAFDLMCRRAVDREVDPGKPLGRRQLVQQWIAESRAEIDGARLMVLKAAWAMDREGAHAARDEVSALKFHVAGVLQKVLDRLLQVHGALGLTDATPLAFWYAHERAARIYDGPDEVHKLALACDILRRYGMKDER